LKVILAELELRHRDLSITGNSLGFEDLGLPN